MSITATKIRVLEGVRPDAIPFDELMAGLQPVILKGLVRDWGLVGAGRRSNEDAIACLRSFYNGKTVATYFADAALGGRLGYDEGMARLNFENRRVSLDEVLDRISGCLHDDRPPTIYVNSMTVDACLPGLRRENDLVFDPALFADHAPQCIIWIGTPSIAAAHYDLPSNIACCVVGRRRYTLFPPDQVENLYPGPLHLNPGGQAISMVDFSNPDFARYPRFRFAIESAQVAELEPGDALFYPSMWWHQVEATSAFNVMINYWWDLSPAYRGTPMHALNHAILSLRDRPEHEKQAWKQLFDYYVFGPAARPRAHLPEHAQGVLAPIDDTMARQLRARLLNALNR